MCDVAIINKVDSAPPDKIEQVYRNIRAHNPKAVIIKADSEVTADRPDLIKGKRALVIEDGPTLTHGEMEYGAGVIAAERFGALEMVDPRPFLVGTLRETFEKYPGIGTLLPAMGYSEQQVGDLEATINRADCDVVISATPIDITALLKVEKPLVRIRYEYRDNSSPTLQDVIRNMFA